MFEKFLMYKQTSLRFGLYYDSKHTQWYKRPDWFAVLGVSRFYAQTEQRIC
jgi:hypothetical protein